MKPSMPFVNLSVELEQLSPTNVEKVAIGGRLPGSFIPPIAALAVLCLVYTAAC
jgi:hypothetical protein